MEEPLLVTVPPWAMALIIFLLIVFFNWLGFFIRKKQMEERAFTEPTASNLIQNSLLGLTALLLAFTFSMVASKFDNRRKIIVEEANHIGTAILRCDLYPDSVRNPLRADFRKYLEARIAYYEAAEDKQKVQTALDSATVYSEKIWERVAVLSHDPANFVRTAQMVPALNNMIDIVTTRDSDRKAKTPRLVLWVVLLFSLLSAFLSGYENKGKRRNALMVGTFAFMMAVSMYLIVEMDRPKQGLINLDVSEQAILDLRKMLEE